MKPVTDISRKVATGMIIKLPYSYSNYVLSNLESSDETTLEFQKDARKYMINLRYNSLDDELDYLKRKIADFGGRTHDGNCISEQARDYLRERIAVVERDITERMQTQKELYVNKLSDTDKVNYAVIAKPGIQYKAKHAHYNDWIYFGDVSRYNRYFKTDIRCFYFEDADEAVVFKLKHVG